MYHAPSTHLLDTLGPYTLPFAAQSAEGALIWDTDGNTYWDFYGGHAVTLLGQGHPDWVEAIARQARQLSFFTTIAPTPVRDRAAEALCAFTNMDAAWFLNSGAEANEGALKIARKATGRSVIVAMQGGFHGRTAGASGVSSGIRAQHAPYHGDVRFVPFGDLDALRNALDEDVAAVITEPMQGVAGIIVPPEGWLKGVQEAAHEVGALLICDEVQSGIGRVGAPLASLAMGVRPDLVTVGKGLGGGFPVSAVLMDARFAEVRPGEYGTTFGGAPLACAAVEATLSIIEREGLMARASAIGEALCERLGAVEGVVDVRGAGAWMAIVLDRPARPVAQQLIREGFLCGTAKDPNVLRLSPPAVLPLYAIDLLAGALRSHLKTAVAA